MSKNGLNKKGRSAHSEELRFTLDSAGRGTAAELLRRLKPYRFKFALSLGLSLVYVFLTLLIPVLAGKIIDCIIGAGRVDFAEISPFLLKLGAAAAGAALSQWLSLIHISMESASIAIIGAADGPTSIVVANHLGISANNPGLFSAIVVAAYSYMALVPIIQRPVIKLITTKHERLIRMEYEQRDVSKLTRILFPIVITFVVGIVAPGGLPLIACLMFGNLLRECGVLNALSETAQKVLANLVTLFLGPVSYTHLNVSAVIAGNNNGNVLSDGVVGFGIHEFLIRNSDKMCIRDRALS